MGRLPFLLLLLLLLYASTAAAALLAALLLTLTISDAHAYASASASALPPTRRQTISRYCSLAAPSVCFAELSTPAASNPVYRVAVADAPATGFEALLQIEAPASAGWAGFAWGGSMTLNPLTVAWPNGNGVVVSSRWATGRSVPSTYRGASYRTLSSSRNATHWAVEVLCSGCSRWSGGGLSAAAGEFDTFAWAVSRGAVAQPASNGSSFAIHDNVGMFSLDLSTAKVPRDAFQRYVSSGGSGGGGGKAAVLPGGD